jgi:hypothetical protein
LSTIETEYEVYKTEKNLTIEKYEREIELNKSLLDLLNNEIKLLAHEKSQLEQQISSLIKKVRPDMSNTPTLGSDGQGDDVQYQKTDNQQTGDSSSIRHEIIQLNQQVEDLTFYIDELKSDLETEKEKNLESFNEIQANQKQIEDFEDQYNRIIKEFEAKSLILDANEKVIRNYAAAVCRLRNSGL